jgi:hypothetical protein
VKNWIGKMNELTAGLLFNGGYVVLPTRPVPTQTEQASGVTPGNPASPVAGRRIDVTTESGRKAVRSPTGLAAS